MIADAGQTAKHDAPPVRAADAAESPDTAGAYPRLSDEQLAALRRHGQRRAIRPGDVVIAEGNRDRDFTVVLAGRVAVHEGYGTHEQRLVAVHGPGRFLDEIGLLTGQPAFVTAVADHLAWHATSVGDRLAPVQLAMKPNVVGDPGGNAPL